MKILGLKLTHDGAICVIENGKLLFSIEFEKLNNNPRFEQIHRAEDIVSVLKLNGVDISDIDHVAIDGWGGFNKDDLAIQPRLKIGEECNFLSFEDDGEKYDLKIQRYRENTLKDDLLASVTSSDLKIHGDHYNYSSYLHVTGHIMSAYATSPFAQRNEDSFVLIWDGGMFPRLYHVSPKSNSIECYGPLFLLIGNIYTIFSQHFGPFKVAGSFAKDSLSIAGKVMAYIARGENREELQVIFKKVLNEGFENAMGYANFFANRFNQLLKASDLNVSDEDILASFHVFIERLLIEKLSKKINRIDKESKNLCISGGCALNIKWNSSIRRANIFDKVYVPPFPNDSGSAIGVALAKHYELTGEMKIDWSVYSGPEIVDSSPLAGWSSHQCSVEELAHYLHTTDEAVVVLNGRAELGPRALGNRSIIAAPVNDTMKGKLNAIKKRELYRPVSPMCTEEFAPEIFVPGTRDNYMLFDHQVKPEWINRIPAVVHEDSSARLQTVAQQDNPFIYQLLKEYGKLSGVPVLCNTSANYNGKGFFPDVVSTMNWGRVNYIWSDGMIYINEGSTIIERELVDEARI